MGKPSLEGSFKLKFSVFIFQLHRTVLVVRETINVVTLVRVNEEVEQGRRVDHRKTDHLHRYDDLTRITIRDAAGVIILLCDVE